MEYFLHLAIFICLYTILAQSLNLAAGQTGLMSLAHAGFYGVGAYSTALLTMYFNFSFGLNLLIAIIISGVTALFISLCALRTVENYFIIYTLSIQVILFSIMNNWMGLTRGPLGIANIPSVKIFGFSFDDKLSFLLLALFFMAIIWSILKNIFNSGFGRTLIAISEDEIYAQSIGKNVMLCKIISFSLSAMFSAVSGVLYAHYISYIDPTSFTVNESIFILSIVIIGGMGNLTGSFVAATFMVLLPEILRYAGMPDNIAANMHQIIYGFILVIIMMPRIKDLNEATEV